MVKATALFGHPEDATPDGSQPPYYRYGELWFENMDQLQGGLGSSEGQEVTQDIQNFATGGVTFLISEVISET